MQNNKIKNIAIVAHVDHGKTTLIDQIFQQAGLFRKGEEVSERVMDSGDLEKERGITITAKNCSIYWKDTKINIIDTPGHADFGGEVERSLMMVNGILLLVDSSEGPLPQTRFVLQKALERNLKVAVMINKIDRPDQRHEEVKTEVEDLVLDLIDNLGLDHYDVDLPFLYGSGRDGYASDDPDKREGDLSPMLDLFVSDYYPEPQVDHDGPFKFLVTNLSYSNYLGTLMIGKILSGSVSKNAPVKIIGKEKTKQFRIADIQIFNGLTQESTQEAYAGEIVSLAGFDEAQIGDTICALEVETPFERIEVEPPTVSVSVCVNTSPMAGKEGEYLTSRGLEEFLQRAVRNNVALQYEPTEDPKIFILKGRGELQLAIVFEEIRRQGYELMVSRPNVILKQEGESLYEPFERVVVDIPEDSTGAVTEKLAGRKGIMTHMQPFGEGRSKIEFEIPSRGLIGFRSEFLTLTRGEGLMSSYFLEYRDYLGKMLVRTNGALISDRKGKTTPYALFNLLSSGRQFIKPGEEVYEGMVVGEHTRTNDLNVNVCREKHLSSVRTAGKDENIILPPIKERTLDWALDWIDDDEWVEITPQNIRIRKKILKANERHVIR
ncbi:MAG: translational GTPase TypA [Halobacteriovoraceae bacterium]|nr:translational GTPase TypA [Halobacteriovoraceae bacterium]MCB9095241.1 translational GTPase TypA [Halobacteriovoraceae bacterium]